MRLGVVGSRSWSDRKLFWKHLCAWTKKCSVGYFDPFNDIQPPPVDEVVCDLHLVSGGAPGGADALAEAFARQKGLSITVHHAKWQRGDGSKDVLAGFARNSTIANDCEVLLAFWDGKSSGTADTCRKALKRGIPVWVVKPSGEIFDGIELIHEKAKHHYPARS